ncbi:MAG TPA: hypothetical protein VFK13_10690 [Gemmatimonadaceae bacterium]|nr:hypothetical protein [Gemmatimonadaceae bacterium]
MKTRTLAVLAFLSGALLPVAAQAQTAAFTGGPTLAAARVAVANPAADAVAAPVRVRLVPAAAARGLSKGAKLMILGGAVLITGAIIGDDFGTVMMVAGGGLAIWGLYLYLDRPLESDVFGPPALSPLSP